MKNSELFNLLVGLISGIIIGIAFAKFNLFVL